MCACLDIVYEEIKKSSASSTDCRKHKNNLILLYIHTHTHHSQTMSVFKDNLKFNYISTISLRNVYNANNMVMKIFLQYIPCLLIKEKFLVQDITGNGRSLKDVFPCFFQKSIIYHSAKS